MAGEQKSFASFLQKRRPFFFRAAIWIGRADPRSFREEHASLLSAAVSPASRAWPVTTI